ncbi:MAG: metallophosphoesterase [Filifactoraceae bacterium]
MSIFAIGDLHLSNESNKPMDIFGWVNHKEKIFDNWKQRVKSEDLVLLAGDISWANYLDEAKADLEDICSMPGKKLIVKGNHDFWWSTLKKMKENYPNLDFLHNNAYVYGDKVIAGTRGWILSGKNKLSLEDERICQREVARLRLSLEEAKKFNKDIIVMMHYPPMNELFEDSLFTDCIKEYEVKAVIYGHLHGKDGFGAGFSGMKDGIEYSLVSCDFLGFKLKCIEK